MEPEFKAADGTVRKLHYGKGKQPWDFMLELDIGFEYAIGCVLKYAKRDASIKQSDREDDLKKGKWYAARSQEILKNHPNTPLGRRRQQLFTEVWGLLTSEERAAVGFDSPF